MKNKVFFTASIAIAFALGCIMTYIAMTKQQMDILMQARSVAGSDERHAATLSTSSLPTHANLVNNDSLSIQSTESADLDLQTNTQTNLEEEDQAYSTNDYTQAQAEAIIENMPDRVLEQYIDKFMATGASDAIVDKRRFAQRAIEELYQPNDNQPLQADVRLSYGSQMPNTSIDTTTIAKDAKLYAHLDTYGRVPTGAFVFVKWVNNDTGQVLLFEKKDIVADSNQNWVSFKPYDGWETGSYDIRFYQFTSELQPIGQLTYHIYEVEGA